MKLNVGLCGSPFALLLCSVALAGACLAQSDNKPELMMTNTVGATPLL